MCLILVLNILDNYNVKYIEYFLYMDGGSMYRRVFLVCFLFCFVFFIDIYYFYILMLIVFLFFFYWSV